QPARDDPPEMRYTNVWSDERFGLLRIHVDGPGVGGTLHARYRPGPVAQVSFETVRTHIRPTEFADQRALVLGGSRGLGEVVAKLLAAGGADVFLTFNTGAADAALVCSEVTSRGGRCAAFRFDVLDPPAARPATVPAVWRPTHVFFFASP